MSSNTVAAVKELTWCLSARAHWSDRQVDVYVKKGNYGVEGSYTLARGREVYTILIQRYSLSACGLLLPLGEYLLPLKEGCANAEHGNIEYGDYACND